MCSVTQTSPLRLLWSFTLLGAFRSTSVPSVYFSPFGPFNPLWSIALSLVHFGPLLHFCPLGTIQSIQSFWSTLVSQVQYIRSFWSTSVYQLHYVESGPIQTICQRTRSFWSSLVHFVHFSLLFPNRHLVVLSMHELS